MKATIRVYNGRDGRFLAEATHRFADAESLADTLMMQAQQRNECIVDVEDGPALMTTLARMDYLDDHFGEGAARRELIEALTTSWRFGQ